MLANSSERYGLISKSLHWLMAMTILFMIGLGVYMTDIDNANPLRPQLYGLHKSIGITLLILAIMRIIWIMASPPPAPLRALQWFEIMIARTIIGLLYLLMLMIPIAGYIMSSAFGKPINYFGFMELPQLIEQNRAVGEFMKEAHEFLAFFILILVALHLIGAIKHRFFSNNPETDVLGRML